ncbi:MAG: tRNA pseudouridine(38-40) synthase TruA, partial [Robiginitomaculum sp.]|nr:tRNA pseudouridine(38-40) synthase TruA [Robiginitomaculum sp.]
APFMGWQIQKNQPSVQGALAAAASAIDGTPVKVFGAGRTDSGVHALGQVGHLDMRKNLRADKLRDGLNFHLGKHPITVLEAEIVAPDFNCRFDAQSRTYLYRILDRRMKLSLDKGRVWRIPVKMDAELMNHAAGVLLGEHDFTTFRDKQCQAKSPIKKLDALSVARVGQEIHIHAQARSFLHRQIRSITGALSEVGTGKLNSTHIEAMLKSCDRTMCSPVAPPDGLYFMRVDY